MFFLLERIIHERILILLLSINLKEFYYSVVSIVMNGKQNLGIQVDQLKKQDSFQKAAPKVKSIKYIKVIVCIILKVIKFFKFSENEPASKSYY
jgi:hypothetical protein